MHSFSSTMYSNQFVQQFCIPSIVFAALDFQNRSSAAAGFLVSRSYRQIFVVSIHARRFVLSFLNNGLFESGHGTTDESSRREYTGLALHLQRPATAVYQVV